MNAALREKLGAGARMIGVPCGEGEVLRFEAYMDLLQLWGRKMNLTSRLGSEEIVVYHFLDSLTLCPHLGPAEEGALIDVGAGAGFPALPIKICLPHLKVALVESSHKRVSFCREVIRRLELPDTVVHEGRGEVLGKDPLLGGAFDWAVARALAPGAEAAGMCLPFLRKEGRLILLKGRVKEEERQALQGVADTSGMSMRFEEVSVPFLEAQRTLVILEKRST